MSISAATLSFVTAIGTTAALTVLPTSSVAATAVESGPPGQAANATPWDEPRPSADAPAAKIVAKARKAGAQKFVITREVEGRLKIQTRRAGTRAAAVDLVSDAQRDDGLLAIEPAVGRAHVLGGPDLPSAVQPATDSGPDPARTVDDPMREQQWALDTLAAEAVWDVSTGDDVVVAVLDTGVAHHADLAESRFVPGTDFSWLQGDGRNDGDGHGTHVAGIVAATWDNGTGIAGLAPEASIMPVKVLDDEGSGYWEDVAQGVVWATDRGADIISMSLGGEDASQALDIATQYAQQHDVVVVAAAGNEREYGSPVSYPAAFPGVVGVAATDADNHYADFSNAGDYVDVSAPGVDVLSTVPADGYESWQGTSMATPYASAEAALLRARAASLGRPLSGLAVGEVMQVSALDLGSPGRDDDYGHGLIQPGPALALLSESGPAPAAPAAVTVTGIGAETADVSWTHPGTDVAGFRVVATPTTGGATTCVAGATRRSCRLTRLRPDTGYTATVVAWNVQGEAPSTAATFRTAWAPPDAGDTFDQATPMPASLTVTETLSSIADVDFWSFSSPEAGTVTVSLTELPEDYDLVVYDADGWDIGWSYNVDTEDDVVSLELPAGRYVAEVRAWEAADPLSPYRLTADVPERRISTPGPPTNLRPTPANGSASIAFTAPASNGGATITNYQYSTDGGATWRARNPARTASPLPLTGLVNGRTYSVRLRAMNQAGPGAVSSAVSVTPRTVPGAPTGLRATPGNGSASIAFTAPASNGGAPITNYQYSTDGGATWRARNPARTASPLPLTGLVNGRTYSVRLRAGNHAGPGAVSSAVSVTPRTVPGAPRGLRVTGFPASTQVALAWGAPGNGGAAITGYRLRVSRANSASFEPWRAVSRTTAVLTGRAKGARHLVQVVAVNAAGTSRAATVAFTQATAPAAVTNLRVRRPASLVARATWKPGANGRSPIRGYRVRLRRVGSAWRPWSTVRAPSRTWTRLRRSVRYRIQVVALNSQGSSPARTVAFRQAR